MKGVNLGNCEYEALLTRITRLYSLGIQLGMHDEDPDAGAAAARELGSILEDLMLSGASHEVLGAFAVRRVKKLQGESAVHGVTDLEVLLEQFGKRVAREVLKEQGVTAAPVSPKAVVRAAAVVEAQPGTLGALLGTPAKKVTCHLFGKPATSVSMPSGLYGALLDVLGSKRVNVLISQWAAEAPGGRQRSAFVQQKAIDEWQKYAAATSMGTMAASLTRLQ